VEEPGRRIVEEELKGSGSALPRVNEAAFAHRPIEMAIADRVSARVMEGWAVLSRRVPVHPLWPPGEMSWKSERSNSTQLS